MFARQARWEVLAAALGETRKNMMRPTERGRHSFLMRGCVSGEQGLGGKPFHKGGSEGQRASHVLLREGKWSKKEKRVQSEETDYPRVFWRHYLAEIETGVKAHYGSSTGPCSHQDGGGRIIEPALAKSLNGLSGQFFHFAGEPTRAYSRVTERVRLPGQDCLVQQYCLGVKQT